jgi:hypothetical protein
MKRSTASIRPGGILRWSTACILAGAGLSSCERDYVATAKDQQMAEAQQRIESLDASKATLMGGEVPNNFHLEGVGWYHAAARDFFPHRYGFADERGWFVNGVWELNPGPDEVAASRPLPEALKKVEAALEKEQQLLAGGSGTAATPAAAPGQGFGMGNALMMYWLLSGNRGLFSPGAGFRNADGRAGGWQRSVESQRAAVNSHAAANPSYRRMVDQSRASGRPVRAGESVRGGFGSSRSRSGGLSFGG